LISSNSRSFSPALVGDAALDLDPDLALDLA
jgi:hypothetical protein